MENPPTSVILQSRQWRDSVTALLPNWKTSTGPHQFWETSWKGCWHGIHWKEQQHKNFWITLFCSRQDFQSAWFPLSNSTGNAPPPAEFIWGETVGKRNGYEKIKSPGSLDLWMVLGSCQWLFWKMNVNPVCASSAFCGFSFAEDNQYRLDLSETKSVSRIKRVFHGLGITAAKGWHSKVESEAVYLNVCEFLHTLATDCWAGTIFPT